MEPFPGALAPGPGFVYHSDMVFRPGGVTTKSRGDHLSGDEMGRRAAGPTRAENRARGEIWLRIGSGSRLIDWSWIGWGLVGDFIRNPIILGLNQRCGVSRISKVTARFFFVAAVSRFLGVILIVRVDVESEASLVFIQLGLNVSEHFSLYR